MQNRFGKLPVRLGILVVRAIDNITKACEKHFSAPRGSCDLLMGDRGPFCFLPEHIIGKKYIIYAF